MHIQTATSEITVQKEHKDYRSVLKEHFNLLYVILSENRLITQADFGSIGRGSEALSFWDSYAIS